MTDITGRDARPEVLAITDLVTEFTSVRRPLDKGFKAQWRMDF